MNETPVRKPRRKLIESEFARSTMLSLSRYMRSVRGITHPRVTLANTTTYRHLTEVGLEPAHNQGVLRIQAIFGFRGSDKPTPYRVTTWVAYIDEFPPHGNHAYDTIGVNIDGHKVDVMHLCDLADFIRRNVIPMIEKFREQDIHGRPLPRDPIFIV